MQHCLNPRPVDADQFKLHDRATHVYSEASRVWEYKQVCDEKKSNALEVAVKISLYLACIYHINFEFSYYFQYLL